MSFSGIKGSCIKMAQFKFRYFSREKKHKNIFSIFMCRGAAVKHKVHMIFTKKGEMNSIYLIGRDEEYQLCISFFPIM